MKHAFLAVNRERVPDLNKTYASPIALAHLAPTLDCTEVQEKLENPG
ncbi:MAG TPA: hypothetical protein VHA06_21615 [Candidatus Angelobacter sp.]|jgi:hypothetical protein|nr:hypothetical protein [Candidatus Angelobacter sp.]